MTNRAAVELFRHPIPYGKDNTAHAVLRLSRPDDTLYDPRDLPLTRSALDGETFTGVEMEIVWPDGQVRHLLANTTPMFDVKQRLTGTVGTFLDISARKELEMQLKERAEELARSNEELQMFAYIASTTSRSRSGWCRPTSPCYARSTVMSFPPRPGSTWPMRSRAPAG